MARKKMILKLFLAAIALLLIATGGFIVRQVAEDNWNARIVDLKSRIVSELNVEYQKYLAETADKIRQLPLSQQLMAEINAEVIKKSPNTRVFFWLSGSGGAFVFGAPSPAFDGLNKAFDKYGDTIKRDGYYQDRNDFLMKLIHRYDDVRIGQFASGDFEREEPRSRYLQEEYVPDDMRWRFFREGEPDLLVSYYGPLYLELSAPVLDTEQQPLGTLFIKIEDHTVQREWYRHKNSFLAKVVFPGVEVIFPISMLLIWFLLPSWVYIDARQREVRNPLRWAIMTALTMGSAWIIYLIVRPEQTRSYHCPQCSGELNGTRAFCPHCGFDLSESFCQQCQYPVKAEWQFCPSCRANLRERATVAAAEETGAKEPQ